MHLPTPDEIFTDIVETPITLEIYIQPPFIENQEYHATLMQQLQIEAHQAPSKQLVVKIKKLIKQYPTVPVLSNLLMLVYSSLDKHWLSLRTLNHSIKKHPEYLTARLNKAGIYCSPHKAHRILKVLEQKLTIREQLPDRELFHGTEILNFYRIVGLYYLLTENIERASSVLRALESIRGLPASDLEVLKSGILEAS